MLFSLKMVDTIMNSFSKLRLSEKEEEGITLETKDVRTSREKCERSILGKLWGSKTVNFTGLKNILNQL